MFDGLLLIDKPEGISSFGVVSRVRWLLTQQKRSAHEAQGYCHDKNEPKKDCKCKLKVGHTGTLDPAATGLLILVVGSYTKRAADFSKLDKTYEVEVTLGKTSTTGDKEGDLSDVDSRNPGIGQIINAVSNFVGQFEQVPPAYSAIKVNGIRAYKLAREGKKPDIKPRIITIYDIRDLTYNYPVLSFTTDVSSGTYIRTLAEDIGKELGTGAYMSNLRRTKVGEFDINNAASLESFGESIAISLVTS